MYLNSAIKHKTLDVAVNTILSQQDEEKCWSLYLSCVANPFSEEITFEDFLKKYGTKTEPTEQKLNKKGNKPKKMNLQQQVLKAEKLLNGFVPPGKKGGAK